MSGVDRRAGDVSAVRANSWAERPARVVGDVVEERVARSSSCRRCVIGAVGVPDTRVPLRRGTSCGKPVAGSGMKWPYGSVASSGTLSDVRVGELDAEHRQRLLP